MAEPLLAVRPFTSQSEYEGMIDYFLDAEPDYLRGMGVNPARLMTREDWLAYVLRDHEQPDAAKDRCYVAWLYDKEVVGHSSVNYIHAGSHANIHLHMWRPDLRRGGIGMRFFRTSANYFMGRFQLQRLLCEPFADNPPPNRVLEKLGFQFVRRHRVVPGSMSDEIDVNLWQIDHLLV